MLKCTSYCQAKKNGHIIFCEIGRTYDFTDGDSYPKNCFREIKSATTPAPKKRKKRKAEGE